MCNNLSLSSSNQTIKPTKNLMNLLICGSNFQSEEHDEDLSPMSANSSPSSTPRRSKIFCRDKNSRDKNPYATRGLDKFSALLADLEEKRQKIYAANGSDPDISFVRFVYKNTNDLVPVVVKLKDNDNNKIKKEAKAKAKTKKSSINVVAEEIVESQSSPERTRDKVNVEAKKASLSWEKRIRRPSYYLPIVVIMILLLLGFFGRSVAILCTSIGWYVVPALNESVLAKKRMKKDYVKKVSEKRMVNEGLVSSPRVNSKTPTRQDHQRNWC